MKPLQVVISHVSRHILLHKLPCWLINFKNPIVFQATKETLNNGIIPTRPHITHAGADTITREQPTELLTGILRASVTVEYQPSRRLPQVCSGTLILAT